MQFSLFENILNIFSYNPLEPLLFNSGFFLFFFLACLIFSHLFVNNHRAKVMFLLTTSLYFYYKSSGVFFILVIISSLIDYFAGHYIYISGTKTQKKLLLVISIITNLGILGYFKYTNFFLDTLNSFGVSDFDMLNIFLPVGVSFFTFQSMSYTIDIYRGNLNPEKNFFDFLFFVSFFPQLVAGPIVRASDFLPQIKTKPVLSNEDLGRAFLLIISGLFKKAVIADFISINFIDRVFEWPTRFTGAENLIALYSYAMQLYCDFSGYSDMAIGLALLLGFRIPENFNSPYKAASTTEFWQRWHISLSSWLRDYLYIGLGGNRKGKGRTYVNLILTMLLGGLWHGATWRMAIWGLIQGTALAIERKTGFTKFTQKNTFNRIIGWLITFNVFTFTLILFRAQSLQTGYEMINQILSYFHPEVIIQFVEGYPVVFGLVVLGYIMHFTPKKAEVSLEHFLVKMPPMVKALILALLVWIVAQFKSADIQPFIYFQF
ncbi:MAG: MBOAT family O-acyltransferase [Ignavibacteria bacterium]|jgi:D-alanyl-lipoteichoic acid acyltransferase DltB (MBOAT superfamily)